MHVYNNCRDSKLTVKNLNILILNYGLKISAHLRLYFEIYKYWIKCRSRSINSDLNMFRIKKLL